jgi:aspartyl-tRNA(Asn)/glutamyl-tRNA(Gln) amidotransferase subunit A
VSDELLGLTVAQQAARIEAGELSAAEAFEYWRGRAAGDELNAYLWVADEAPEDAGSLPPIAVKDLFCVRGVPSMAGSRILEGYRPPYSATSVRNLEGAGVRVLGKTNQDEFAMGSSNENSGFGPVQNPWDRTSVPGGSSGGSAAAVAAGTAPWAIGTDTGGSIRQPASLCGVVGMKPTYGAVSRYGMIAFASSLDQCGPLTRDVTDAALLLRYLEGRDPCDSTSLGIPGGVEQIELPNAGYGIPAYYVIAPAEASANLARYDGVRYGKRSGNGDLTSLYEQTRHDGFGEEVRRRIMIGTYALSSGYYEAYYGTAQKVRTKIAEDLAAAFERVDFVVSPTSATVAFRLGERTQDPLAMYLSDYYTVPMPLAGIPAISIPCGLSEGLPVGFQIAGPAFSETRILDAGHALEKSIGFEGVPVG